MRQDRKAGHRGGNRRLGMNRGQRRARWLAQHRYMTRTTPVAPHLIANEQTAASASITRAPSAGKIHIEELVLHGFPTASAHAIGEATQQELTRVLTVRGLPGQMTRDATRVR